MLNKLTDRFSWVRVDQEVSAVAVCVDASVKWDVQAGKLEAEKSRGKEKVVKNKVGAGSAPWGTPASWSWTMDSGARQFSSLEFAGP